MHRFIETLLLAKTNRFLTSSFNTYIKYLKILPLKSEFLLLLREEGEFSGDLLGGDFSGDSDTDLLR